MWPNNGHNQGNSCPSGLRWSARAKHCLSKSTYPCNVDGDCLTGSCRGNAPITKYDISVDSKNHSQLSWNGDIFAPHGIFGKKLRHVRMATGDYDEEFSITPPEREYYLIESSFWHPPTAWERNLPPSGASLRRREWQGTCWTLTSTILLLTDDSNSKGNGFRTTIFEGNLHTSSYRRVTNDSGY